MEFKNDVTNAAFYYLAVAVAALNAHPNCQQYRAETNRTICL